MSETKHIYRVFIPAELETEVLDFLDARRVVHTYEFTETTSRR